MKQVRVGVVVVLTMICCSLFGQAQQTGAASTNVVVPTLVSFSGVLTGSNGKPLTSITGVTFSLYAEQEGGAPLWLETQNVQPDKNGNYTVQLGSTTSQGLPASLFASGQARWLGVQPQGQQEQPRIMLLSVPYALKAGDAQTLGGKPASAFLTASGNNSPSPNGVVNNALSGSGTKNYVPLWLSSSKLGNSKIFQSAAGDIGIGTTSPTAPLDVKGNVTVTATGITINASGGTIGLSGTGSTYGVDGNTSTGYGVYGAAGKGSGVGGSSSSGNGVYGVSVSGYGMYGASDSNVGVYGLTGSSAASGVYGYNSSSSGGTGVEGSGPSVGVYGTSTTGTGVDGLSSSGAGMTGTSTSGYGVYGVSSSSDGVYGQTNSASANAYGVYGLVSPTSATGAGVFGQSNSANANGVVGQGANGVAGTSTASTGVGGVFTGWSAPSGSGQGGTAGLKATGGAADPAGDSMAGDGLDAYGGDGDYSGDGGGFGVFGDGGNGGFVDGVGGYFVGGDTSGDGDGVHAVAGSGYAGNFTGDVHITGNLSKGGGSFKIDDPLDPANKYLYHSFVESPDMMNVYNGNVVLDSNGEAVVDFPEWFGVLNRDFRYQLTCIGGFAPVYVAEEISNNRFRIAGGRPGLKVSWQVTGIRQDAWANAHRIPVEEEKEARLKGFYIHPELYGAPEEKQIEWARHPQMMKKMQQVRQAQQQRRQAASAAAVAVATTVAAAK